MPFSFKFPADIPSSCEVEDGFVRHYLKVTIDRPLRPDSHEFCFLSLNNLYDLNYVPECAVSKNLRDPKIPPTKIPPTKIPPTKIPPTKIPPSENSTQRKFHPAKIPPSENSTQRKFHPAKIRLG